MRIRKSLYDLTEEAAANVAGIVRTAVQAAWEVSTESSDPNKKETYLSEEQVILELYMRVASSSQRKVAKAAGISPSQLNTVLKGTSGISEAMARKFGYERRTVFVRTSEKG